MCLVYRSRIIRRIMWKLNSLKIKILKRRCEQFLTFWWTPKSNWMKGETDKLLHLFFAEYLIKWTGLPYSECTWEDKRLIPRGMIEEYEERIENAKLPSRSAHVSYYIFFKTIPKISMVISSIVNLIYRLKRVIFRFWSVVRSSWNWMRCLSIWAEEESRSMLIDHIFRTLFLIEDT